MALDLAYGVVVAVLLAGLLLWDAHEERKSRRRR